MIKLSKFTEQLKERNFRTLWLEVVVLSIIIGAGLYSWIGFVVMLMALTWFMMRPWKKVYLYVVLSCIWSFLAGVIGYNLGGWAWALLLGGMALISGIRIHLRDLSFNRSGIARNIKTFARRQNWYLGPHNLN